MNRRDLFKYLMATSAVVVSAGGIELLEHELKIESGKTIVLPPAGGWVSSDFRSQADQLRTYIDVNGRRLEAWAPAGSTLSQIEAIDARMRQLIEGSYTSYLGYEIKRDPGPLWPMAARDEPKGEEARAKIVAAASEMIERRRDEFRRALGYV
jgi:hypothetical protein